MQYAGYTNIFVFNWGYSAPDANSASICASGMVGGMSLDCSLSFGGNQFGTPTFDVPIDMATYNFTSFTTTAIELNSSQISTVNGVNNSESM